MESKRSIISIFTAVLLLVSLVLPSICVFGDPDYPILITQVRTIDIQGNPRSSFARGQTVVVEVTLQSQVPAYGPNTSYMLIVEIFDPDGIVVNIGFVTGTIAPGQIQTSGAGYTVPYYARIGTFTAKVFVWNGWPSQKGPDFEVLADQGQVPFGVT